MAHPPRRESGSVCGHRFQPDNVGGDVEQFGGGRFAMPMLDGVDPGLPIATG